MRKILAILTFFLTIISCQKNDISQNEKNALLEKIKAETIKPSFGGKIYGDLTVLQRNESEIFVWAVLQEYYGENNSEKGMGISGPLKVNFNGNPITQDKITHIEKSGDGSLYAKNFPKEIQNKISKFQDSKVLKDMITNLKNNPIN